MNWFTILLVGTGGFAGSVARYLLARSVDLRVASLIPFGTLVVNVLGSFILGLVFSVALKKPEESEAWRLLVGVGFCGGFTTFSTFALENLQLFQQKHFTEFLIYTGVSILLCLLGTGLGVWMGNKVW
ncbi:MAG TPA: fluoride efflux transporter CrcB [Ohtaekwangia sp.]